MAESSHDYVCEDLSTPGYGSDLLSRFREFREEGLFCDLQLKVEYDTFKVHRMVVAGCSDYFRALFSHDMQDKNTGFVELNELTLDGVRPLIDYAYTGKLTLSLITVPEILAAATFLQVTHAIELCSKFLRSRMTFHNAEKLVTLGCNHGLPVLVEHQTKMVLENFFEFAETDQFLQLDAKTLAGYLVHDSLRTTTEGRLLKQVLRWYNHEPKKREKDVYEVLEKIRYTLDGWPTIEYASEVEPFISNHKCQELMAFCQDYMRHAQRKHLRQSHRTRVRYDCKTIVLFGGIRNVNSLFADDIDIHYPDNQNHSRKIGCCRNYYYQTNLEVWHSLGAVEVSEPRSHSVMVEVNDFGILCGGYIYSNDFESMHRHSTNEVTLFTPGGFAMWDLKPMHQERAQFTVVHAPGFLYAIGGHNDERALKSVERFNLEKEKWTFVRSLSKPVFDHAGAADKHKVYISGGTEPGPEISNKFMSYDPVTDHWEEETPLLSCRTGHTMTELGGHLIVCGGQTRPDTTRCLASVESYDLELQQWTHITPMRHDCWAMTATVLSGQLLILGGEDSVGDLSDMIQVYDPDTKTWGRFGKLPYPAKNVSTCALTIKQTNSGEEDEDSLAEAYGPKYMTEDFEDFEAGNYYESEEDNIDYPDYWAVLA